MVAYIDVLFWFASLYILPIWGLMWFMPTHERTKQLMNNEWLFLTPLLTAYVLAVIPNLADLLIALSSDMPTPDLVADLFSTREIALVAWLHFLAFDTLAGKMTWSRLMKAEKPIQITMPILFLSMMVAPLGYLLGQYVTRDLINPVTEPIAA
ncbi:MAG: DUF4281 domain-containing protein [Candidatus Poseidoniales archaeon]|nr:MAG: DUF4281 domain-containing protein [Candidatus Poseidoniales archaeon]